MKLYYKSGACSLSPHIALEESGLGYEAEAVDLAKKITASGNDFWKVNPQGSVPALVLDDGDLLTEGAAIVQYIADKAPAKGLAPANGTVARYKMQAWLNFVGTELHKNFAAFFNPLAKDDAVWQGMARANLEKRYAHVNTELAGKKYLLGDAFSVADGYLFTTLRWAKAVGFDLAKWPNIAAYFDRVSARPGVQSALRAEGLA